MKFTFPPESRPLAGYTIKRAIDRGGFGEVYYALSDAGKEVALKLLQHNLDVELRGVRQCLNLRHANLVTIFDIRTDPDEDHWIVMEYAGGETLEQILAKSPHRLSPEVALHWIRGIAAGVDFLHSRGLVHRDLKPGNIFHDQGTVKVGDVGLTKFITPSRRSAQSESVGTVHYMAPEVARGRYGPEVDVYSSGVMLYEMLVGKLPFEGESSAEILMKHLTASPDLAALPAGLRPLLGRALEKDPELRLKSVTDLANGLQKFLAGESPVLQSVPPLKPSSGVEGAGAVNESPQEPEQRPPLSEKSANHGDELDRFWYFLGIFVRAETRYLRKLGSDFLRFWRSEIPVVIQWGLSPVLVFLFIAMVPTLLMIAGCYLLVRELIRIAIWMFEQTPGTNPWTRLFSVSENSETDTTSFQVQAAQHVSPVFERAIQPAAPEPVVRVPIPPPLDKTTERRNRRAASGRLVGTFMKSFWLTLVFCLGICGGILGVCSLSASASTELFFNRVTGSPIRVTQPMNSAFGAFPVPVIGLIPAGGGLLVVGGLMFWIALRLVGVGAQRKNADYGLLSLAFFLLAGSLGIAVGGGLVLTMITRDGLDVGLAANGRVLLMAAGMGAICSIFMIYLAVHPRFYHPESEPVASPEPVSLPVKPVSEKVQARTGNWKWIFGFLGIWSAFAFGWVERFPNLGGADKGWLNSSFIPTTWGGLSLIVWSVLFLVFQLAKFVIPKLSPSECPSHLADPGSKRGRLRITTGYLQGLLCQALLALGFTTSLLGLVSATIPNSIHQPWALLTSDLPRSVWIYSFLTLSAGGMLSGAYLQVRYDFRLHREILYSLLIGLLWSGLRVTLEALLGPLLANSVSDELIANQLQPDKFGESLLFFLPIAVFGSWNPQLNFQRSRRFELTTVIRVVLLTYVTAMICGESQPYLWSCLMGGLSCIIQMTAPWSDPQNSGRFFRTSPGEIQRESVGQKCATSTLQEAL